MYTKTLTFGLIKYPIDCCPNKSIGNNTLKMNIL